MKITRESAQEQCLELSKQKDVIFVEWATGIGKSLAAISIQNSMGNPNTLVCVPRRELIENIKAEYRKHGYEYLLDNTTIICYASLHLLVSSSWDFVILDEAHNLSDYRLESLETLKFKKAVFLSATLKRDVKEALENMFYNKRIGYFKVTTQEAIDNEILPEPTIYVHKLKLSASGRTETVTIKRGKPKSKTRCDYRSRFKFFKLKDLDLTFDCSQQEKYDHLLNEAQYWENRYKDEKEEYQRLKMLRKYLDVKNFLGEAKTKYVQNLLQTIPPDNRLICFCSSIAQANILGDETNTVHSQMPNVKETIRSFQDFEVNRLFAVGMLKEGMNLNAIDAGILIQLDGTELSLIQKLGRVLRSKNPVIHVIYFQDSRDEKYMKNLFKNIDKKNLVIV